MPEKKPSKDDILETAKELKHKLGDEVRIGRRRYYVKDLKLAWLRDSKSEICAKHYVWCLVEMKKGETAPAKDRDYLLAEAFWEVSPSATGLF